MSNVIVKDANGSDKYLKATGAGTDLDPFVVEQAVMLDTSNAAGDAFGRLRVSNPETIFSQKFLYGKSSGTFFSEELNGTATSVHDAVNSCIDMDVSTSGDFAIRQSNQRPNYQAGKSQFIKCTGIMTPTANVVQRIGAFQGGTSSPFDVLDGLCFEADGAEMKVCIYKGGVENKAVAQSAWNVDKMDGTGPSGITVDWTKCQIFMIDYQWLGVGAVRFYLDIDGVAYLVHKFSNANDVTNVYMRSPNQPIRYEIRSTGGTGSLKMICCAVESEGGLNPAGLTASISTPAEINVGNTNYELLKAIRLKAGQADATVLVEKVNTIAISSGDYEYVVCWNPIIAGTVTWSDVTGAAIQEANGDGSTNNVTPTLVVDGGFNSSDVDAKTTTIDSTLRLGSQIDGTMDVIALAVKTESGSDNFKASMTLRQLV